jgi:hypothetical protein
MKNDVMIDLETLSTTPDAAILSIGAVILSQTALKSFASANTHSTSFVSLSDRDIVFISHKDRFLFL